MEEDIITLRDFAEFLADEAAKITRPLFRRAAAETKPDSSLVSEADRKAEAVMRTLIANNYPHHGIHGEETGVSGQGAEYCWFLDPIDGTSSFLTGRPIFGTLICLARKGKPIIGLIDQPVTDERWLAAEKSCTLNNKAVKTRECSFAGEAVIGTTSPLIFSEAEYRSFQSAAALTKAVIFGGDCYLYAQLAAGFLDAVIESGLKPHDFAALIPVVENAGGVITDWEGKPLSLSNQSARVLAAGDMRTHRQLMELLKTSS